MVSPISAVPKLSCGGQASSNVMCIVVGYGNAVKGSIASGYRCKTPYGQVVGGRCRENSVCGDLDCPVKLGAQEVLSVSPREQRTVTVCSDCRG